MGLQLPLASAPRASLPALPCRHVPPGARPSPVVPPQVFVELNELMLDRSQEPHWRETARWIKFEEDVEEETERWGKPHVASLSFRSLLELRRTIAHGRDSAGLVLGLRALFTDCRARARLPNSRGVLPGVLGPGLTACTAVSPEGQGGAPGTWHCTWA